MNKYTCGITVEGDSINHVYDKISNLTIITKVFNSKDLKVVCTQQQLEPSAWLFICFISLVLGIILGIGLRLIAKKDK